MPVTIIESDSYPGTLTAPQANEPASAPTLISEFLQGIANRTNWLKNRRTTDSAAITSLGIQTDFLREAVVGAQTGEVYTIEIPLNCGMTAGASSPNPWYVSLGTFNTRPFLISRDTGQCVITYDISPFLPHSGTPVLITGIFATIQPATGHAALPVTMPQGVLFSQGYASGSFAPTPTILATQTDGSGTVSNFQQVHSIGNSITPTVFDASLQYYYQISSEFGTNALSGCKLGMLKIQVTGQ